MLSVRAADGSRRAIVFGYACHATSSPADYQITADWPGYAQAAIEAANPGATAMFVNGCGADCDPIPRSTVELPKMYGDIMGVAVGQVFSRQMRLAHRPADAGLRLRGHSLSDSTHEGRAAGAAEDGDRHARAPRAAAPGRPRARREDLRPLSVSRCRSGNSVRR